MKELYRNSFFSFAIGFLPLKPLINLGIYKEASKLSIKALSSYSFAYLVNSGGEGNIQTLLVKADIWPLLC